MTVYTLPPVVRSARPDKYPRRRSPAVLVATLAALAFLITALAIRI